MSFGVEPGEVIGLLGPNGAGKTTLMKILTGYLQPDEGSAEIVGIDVVERPREAQEHIGYLPENAPLYGEMAVQEYLQMIAALRRVPVDKQGTLLSRAVMATGLEGYVTRSIGKLSKGYRQRVGIAQAILHEPESADSRRADDRPRPDADRRDPAAHPRAGAALDGAPVDAHPARGRGHL